MTRARTATIKQDIQLEWGTSVFCLLYSFHLCCTIWTHFSCSTVQRQGKLPSIAVQSFIRQNGPAQFYYQKTTVLHRRLPGTVQKLAQVSPKSTKKLCSLQFQRVGTLYRRVADLPVSVTDILGHLELLAEAICYTSFAAFWSLTIKIRAAM